MSVYMYRVKNSKYGSVAFKAERMKACCGVTIIYGVCFTPLKNNDAYKKKLYEWFYNTVLFGKRDIKSEDNSIFSNIVRDAGHLRVNKFIMADRTTPIKNGGTIYEFCHAIPAIKKGEITDNPNSSFKIQSFELNRPKDKYVYENNGQYIEPKK